MTVGRLIGVVGPSGVGKDSVIAGIIDQSPDMRRVTRTITRAPGLGGEDYVAVTPEEFDAALQNGAFCLHWQAHGLSYGIPEDVLGDVQNGVQRIANLSRRVLSVAQHKFPRFDVLNITADPDILRARLAARGREDAADIAARIARASDPIAPCVPVITICNDGPLQETVHRALDALRSETLQ